VAPGAAADATRVGDLQLAGRAWISLVIRDGRLLSVQPGTMLRAGDEAVVLSSHPDATGLNALFTEPAPPRTRDDAPPRATANAIGVYRISF
jgi:NhaP-type Na+/H+ and K+/H+ antiporter